jgi:endonuclease/exonuclease/phosphatase family metal-dependent hydrolase
VCSSDLDLAVLFDVETSQVKLLPEMAAKHHDRLTAKTAGGKTVFPRHPLFAECTVAADNDQEVKFILMVVHLKAFGDAESRARRRLAAEALAAIVEEVRNDTGLPVVLGGDFNERIDTDVLGALTGSPDLLAMTADDATTDAVSYVGGSRRSLIDHIVVSRDARLAEISGDDTAIVRLDRSVRDFADRVSDHLPLVFRMVYRSQPVDIEPVEPDQAHRLAIPDGATALEVSFEAS